MIGAACFAQKERAHAQRQNRLGHLLQVAAVAHEAPRIALAVLADIRTSGVLGVGPPVRPFADIVVRPGVHVQPSRPLVSDAPRSVAQRLGSELVDLGEIIGQRRAATLSEIAHAGGVFGIDQDLRMRLVRRGGHRGRADQPNELPAVKHHGSTESMSRSRAARALSTGG